MNFMNPPHIERDIESRGDLFGLLKVKLNTNSDLYKKGNFVLSFPPLNEDKGSNLFSTYTNEIPSISGISLHEDEINTCNPVRNTPNSPPSITCVTCDEFQSKVFSNNINFGSSLVRPYLSYASKQQFFYSLNSGMEINLQNIWLEEEVIRCLLLSLSGIESSLINKSTSPPIRVAVPGISTAVVANVINKTYQYFAIRSLLEDGKIYFLNSADIVQKSIGVAIEDILHRSDTSLLQYVGSNHDNTNTITNDNKITTISYYWKFTAQHRAIMEQLLQCIISLPCLTDRVQSSNHHSDPFNSILHLYTSIENKWKWEWELSSGHGWEMCHHLLTIVNNLMKIANNNSILPLPSFTNQTWDLREITTSNYPRILLEDSACLPVNTTRILVAAYLCKKAFDPVLELLTCRVFRLVSDPHTISTTSRNNTSTSTNISLDLFSPLDKLKLKLPDVNVQEILTTSSISAQSLWEDYPYSSLDAKGHCSSTTKKYANNEVSLVSKLIATLLWTEDRLTLLSTMGVTTTMNDQDRSKDRDYSNIVNFLIAECTAKTPTLTIPLNHTDLINMNTIVQEAERRLHAIQLKVSACLDAWNQSKDIKSYNNSRSSSSSHSSSSSSKDSGKEGTVPTPTADTASLPLSNELPVNDSDIPLIVAVDITPSTTNDKIEGSRSTPVAVGNIFPQFVDQGMIDTAKSQILQRFEVAMKSVEKKRAWILWRQNRVHRKHKAMTELNDLIQSEALKWSQEIAYRNRSQWIQSNLQSYQNNIIDSPKVKLVYHPVPVPLTETVCLLPEGNDEAQSNTIPLTTLITNEAIKRLQLFKDRKTDVGHEVGILEPRQSVRVSQAPGGTSTMDLSHYEGTENHRDNNNISGNTDNALVEVEVEVRETERQSVRVSQAPGGTSTMDLSHYEGSENHRDNNNNNNISGNTNNALVDVEVEAEAGVRETERQSVRVSQAPGGTSTMDLSHYEGSENPTVNNNISGNSDNALADVEVEAGVRETERQSVRVSQAPGGTSTMDLSHYEGSENHRDNNNNNNISGNSDNALVDVEVEAGVRETERQSVRVSQAPGGTSTMDLSHYVGSENPRDNNNNISGNSDNALADVEVEAGAGVRETERQSVRISQAPGGTSTMDLSHYVGSENPRDNNNNISGNSDNALVDVEVEAGVRETERLSVRVSQAPGGTSTMDLTHYEGSENSMPSSRKKSPAISVDKSVISAIIDNSVRRDTVFPVNHLLVPDQRSLFFQPSDVFVNAAIGISSSNNRLTSSTGNEVENIYTEEESLFEAMGDLSSSLFDLMGMLPNQEEVEEDSDIDEEEGVRKLIGGGKSNNEEYFSLLTETTTNRFDLSPLLASSLIRAMQLQTLALDQTVLLTTLLGADALGHLNCIDDLFVISSRSDFLLQLASTMVEGYMSSPEYCTHLVNITTDRSNDTSTEALQNSGVSFTSEQPMEDRIRSNNNQQSTPPQLWTPRQLQAALNICLSKSSIKYASYSKFLLNFDVAFSRRASQPYLTISSTDHLSSQPIPPTTAITTTTTTNNLPQLLGLFAFSGLFNLEISYEAPWPLPAIFPPTTLKQLNAVTIRLLQLFQLLALSRIIYGEIHALKRLENTANPKRRYWSKELYVQFRSIRNLIQCIMNFTYDRIRTVQLQLQQKLRTATSTSSTLGFSGLINLITNYAKDLTMAQFSEIPLHNYLRQKDMITVNTRKRNSMMMMTTNTTTAAVESIMGQASYYLNSSTLLLGLTISDLLSTCLEAFGELYHLINLCKLKNDNNNDNKILGQCHSNLMRSMARVAGKVEDLKEAAKCCDQSDRDNADILLLFLGRSL